MSENLLAIIIGENIVSQRKRLNISQKELAAKLSISYESMGRIERGKMFPKLGRLQEIAYFLQCPVASLFDDKRMQNNDNIAFINELVSTLTDKEQKAVIKVLLATIEAMKSKEKNT